MMTRKDFLKKSALISAGLPFATWWLSACKKEEILSPNFDVNFSGRVLVIGAGAAGLTAGYLLDRYNIDFEILEASSVLGGRIKREDNLADFPIDLGAEWIHENPSVLARLISNPDINASVDVIPYSPKTIYTWNNNKLKKHNWASNFYSEYKFKSTTWYGFFEKYIARNILDKINYDSPVTEIDYSGDKITINTGSSTFQADKVLVTVPIKILQEQSITFTPPLSSERKNAINNVTMPDGIKVFIEFSEKFYPDMLFIGKLFEQSQEQEKLFYNAAFGKDSTKHVLALFTVGDNATPYTQLNTDNEILTKVLNELDEIFDGKASTTYLNHSIQNWSKEPYIKGAYGIEFNGSYSSIVNTLKQPINNKVFFAGEVYSQDNGATVPGAAESAYDMVERILK